MITCQHARHLFDSYLDGELSASLQTELHAHRLSCTGCQNELALLEACGDVIAMDRREPEVGGDFTSRVLLAYHGRPVVKRRRWGRVALRIGAPMAAAASIALVMSVMVPRTRHATETGTAAMVVAAPKDVRDAIPHRALTPEEEGELARAKQMSESSFADAVRASYDRFMNTREGIRRSGEELGQLVTGFSTTNAKLATLWEDRQKLITKPIGPSEQRSGDVDPSDPSYLSQPPAVPDAGAPSEGDGPVEAL